MKKDFKVTIYPMTAKKDIKEAKEVVRELKKSNGTSCAFECMELETYDVHHVTTYSKKDGELKRIKRPSDLQYLKRPCNLRRTTPLQIEVKVMCGRTTLEVSWYAEGSIDDKPCFAEITTLAIWENGWYKWFDAEDDGTPAAPLATIYINEENINN